MQENGNDRKDVREVILHTLTERVAGLNWQDRVFNLLAIALAGLLAYIGGRIGTPPTPPNPPGSNPPATTKPGDPIRADAWNAIGRIQFGSSGCSATVIGPRRPDGRYWVLTAAHCVRGTPNKGSMRFRDGRTTGITIVAVDKESDCCWCVTDSNSEVFPFAILAPASPPVGAKIWHGGYGIDKPGNKEDGEVVNGPGPSGQIGMHLSVSPGDSGGGICLTENGYVVSCVCCTTRLGGPGTVFGASPESIAKLKPATTDALNDWTPIPVPECHGFK